MLLCAIGEIEYDFIELDSLVGEHTTQEFKEKHPSLSLGSEELPVLVDGHLQISGGGSLTIIKHLCNRVPSFKKRFAY